MQPVNVWQIVAARGKLMDMPMKCRLGTLAALFFVACGGSEAPSETTAPDDGGLNDVVESEAEVPQDAVQAVDLHTDTALNEDTPSPPADLCNWPALEAETCAAATSLGLGEPDHVAVSSDGAGGAIVAWSTGSQLSVAHLDGDGAQVGGVYVTTVEAPLSGLTAAPSDEMMMVFYSTGRLGEHAPEDVVLRYRAFVVGSGLGEPVILAENFELRPGGISTIVGPRVRGVTRQVKGDTTYELLALTLMNHDGSVRTTHTVRTDASFAYYRIHASGSRVHYPFVDA
ncbi:MAG: hypothetical protein ACI9OJ_000377, partial [Myxococcota bacterium]